MTVKELQLKLTLLQAEMTEVQNRIAEMENPDLLKVQTYLKTQGFVSSSTGSWKNLGNLTDCRVYIEEEKKIAVYVVAYNHILGSSSDFTAYFDFASEFDKFQEFIESMEFEEVVFPVEIKTCLLKGTDMHKDFEAALAEKINQHNEFVKGYQEDQENG